MFVVGLLLVLLGALAIVAALFGSGEGTVEFLNMDLNAFAIFAIGLGSGIAILWGYTIAKFGVKRSMQHRRESKRLQELSEKLDKVDEDKRRDVDDDRI